MMTRPVARRCHLLGFTLLEILIALAILTVGSTCVVALFSAALETYRRSELEQAAVALGQEALDVAEDLMAHAAERETLPQAVKDRVAMPAAMNLAVTFEEKASNSLLVTVRVTSIGRGKTREWRWERTVLEGLGGRVMPLSETAPRRYRLKAGG